MTLSSMERRHEGTDTGTSLPGKSSLDGRAPNCRERIEVLVEPDCVVMSPFHGLGVQWDPFEYPPSREHWELIERRMDFCRPGYLRVMISTRDYLLGHSDDGAPGFVWELMPYGDKAIAWDNGQFAQLLRILRYAQSRGIPVILGEWSPPDTRLIACQTDPAWPAAICELLTHLRDRCGFSVIRYFNIINEPNGDWSGNKDYETWVRTARNLHRRLARRGLDRTVAIVGPDATVSSDWPESLTWLDRAVRDLSAEIGAWDLHWYAHDHEVFRGEIERILTGKRRIIELADPGGAVKTRFLCESGIFTGRTNGDQQPRVRTFEYGVMIADYVAQVARAGWQGAVAWSLDDAMHAVSPAVRHDPPDELTLKVWGFWNSQGPRMGRPEDLRIRPWFYPWSLMSRLFPPGAAIVRASHREHDRFRAVAASIAGAGAPDMSVMLVNNADAAHVVTVRVAGSSVPVTLFRYDYFDDRRPVDADGFPVPSEQIPSADFASGLEITVPGRGLVFLTSLGP